MKRACSLAIGVIALCLIGAQTRAAPFEALFKLTKITGDCTVEVPGGAPAKAEEGKAYPYGTKITAGRNSSAIVEFSKGNECRVLAGTTLAVTEDAKDKKLKVIKLAEGSLDIQLEEKFHDNNALNVETATAICGAIGCHFKADARRELDLEVALFNNIMGLLRILGPDFEIPNFGKDSSVSVSGDRERTFTRVRNIRGNYQISLLDPNGKPRMVNIVEGSVIKIWRRPTEDQKSTLITILISGPDGKVIEAFNITIPNDRRPEPPPPPPRDGMRPPPPPGPPSLLDEQRRLDEERRLVEELMRIRMELERLERIRREHQQQDAEDYPDVTPSGRR